MNESANNKTNALAGLLNKLDLPTLILVIFMGGGNLLATKQDGNLTRVDAERVAREVHALHDGLYETQKRQNVAIENLNQLLQGQQRILTEIHRWQQNYKRPE